MMILKQDGTKLCQECVITYLKQNNADFIVLFLRSLILSLTLRRIAKPFVNDRPHPSRLLALKQHTIDSERRPNATQGQSPAPIQRPKISGVNRTDELSPAPRLATSSDRLVEREREITDGRRD